MSLLTPGFTYSVDPNQLDRFLLVWRICLASFIVMIPLNIVFLLARQDMFYLYFSGLSLAFANLIYLKFTLSYKHTALILGWAGSLMINVSLFISDDPFLFADFLWVILGNLIVFYVIGVKSGFALLSLNAISIVCFILFGFENKAIDNLASSSLPQKIAFSIEMIMCMFLICYAAFQSIKLRDASEKRLKDQNELLVKSNLEIERNNEEKTILIKEVHHRVKNNLQIIVSLLRLQMLENKNQEIKDQFTEAINRISAMASIHQRLFQQEEIVQLELDSYIRELISDLKSAYANTDSVHIDIRSNCRGADLNIIVPLGLLLNELLSNSLKHAFQNKGEGKIVISIEDNSDALIVEYADNGIWKDSGRQGFGLELIDLLVEQLNGIKTFETSESGTKYLFHLQKEKKLNAPLAMEAAN